MNPLDEHRERLMRTKVLHRFKLEGDEVSSWVLSYLEAFAHQSGQDPYDRAKRKRYRAAFDMGREPLIRWLRWIEANGERIPWCGEVVSLAVSMKLGVKP